MLILIVEDSVEQIEIAKGELTSLGCKIAVARTLIDARRLMETLRSTLNGIITDLHFPESNEPGHFEKTADKPNGLAVVAEAVKSNIPVAVCSDIDHHFAKYATAVVEALATHQNYKPRRIPFLMDRKNWFKTAQELVNLITEEKGK